MRQFSVITIQRDANGYAFAGQMSPEQMDFGCDVIGPLGEMLHFIGPHTMSFNSNIFAREEGVIEAEQALQRGLPDETSKSLRAYSIQQLFMQILNAADADPTTKACRPLDAFTPMKDDEIRGVCQISGVIRTKEISLPVFDLWCRMAGALGEDFHKPFGDLNNISWKEGAHSSFALNVFLFKPHTAYCPV